MLAQLLQHEGALRGQQILSRAKVREALRRTGRPGYVPGGPNEAYLATLAAEMYGSSCPWAVSGIIPMSLTARRSR